MSVSGMIHSPPQLYNVYTLRENYRALNWPLYFKFLKKNLQGGKYWKNMIRFVLLVPIIHFL